MTDEMTFLQDNTQPGLEDDTTLGLMDGHAIVRTCSPWYVSEMKKHAAFE